MNDVLNFTLIYAHLNLGNNKAASSEFNSNSSFAKSLYNISGSKLIEKQKRGNKTRRLKCEETTVKGEVTIIVSACLMAPAVFQYLFIHQGCVL